MDRTHFADDATIATLERQARRIAKLEAALRAILALPDVDADERSVIARDALAESGEEH